MAGMRLPGQLASLVLLLSLPVAQGKSDFVPPPGLYEASLHTFDLIRSGVAIDDASTGIHHPASHTQDAALAGTGEHCDLTGGWYNAADFGKWTDMTAITVSYMLELYARQEVAASRSHGNPEQPDPKLLENVRWGLAWLLKMQDVDGGVRHKVDGATQASLSAAWGQRPELDPNLRVAAPAATGSTADFAAIMYRAAEFVRRTDPAASLRFQAAADRAWNWIGKHPDVAAHDPFYADHDFGGEKLWALAEHDLTYGVASPSLAQELRSRVQNQVSSADPSLFGVFQLASSSKSPVHVRKLAKAAILRRATQVAEGAETRPYRVVLGERDYSWGSAERVLQWAAFFLMADSLQPTPLLHRAALDQLHWILGNNPARHSFVTSFGTNPVRHPYHWIYQDYGIAMPGWAVLGPNGYPDGVDPALKALQEKGTAPARCYVDLCSRQGSWASNEGQISEEAALVFVTGRLRLPPSRPGDPSLQ
jgi:endoglucanase